MENQAFDYEYNGEPSENVGASPTQRETLNIEALPPLRAAQLLGTPAVHNVMSNNLHSVTRNQRNQNSNLEGCTRCAGELLLSRSNNNLSSGRTETSMNFLPSNGRILSNARRTNEDRTTGAYRDEVGESLCVNSESNGRHQRHR